MSALFGKQPRMERPKPEPTPPSPRDEEARAEAERMRRSGALRGRQSTVLTPSATRRLGPGHTSPRRTVVGGGGP